MLDQPKSYFATASAWPGWVSHARRGGSGDCPNERPVVCIAGDGSAQYAMHALWTAANSCTRVTFGVLVELFCREEG